MAERLNHFYSEVTQVIVQHGIVDKLIGDEVMGLHFPALTRNGRYVDAMVSDALAILRTQGRDSPNGPRLEVGIGLDVGPAYVGIVGEGEIRDFTAIGDVVNTASRLQGVAAGARSSCTRLSRASLRSTGARSSRSTSRVKPNP